MEHDKEFLDIAKGMVSNDNSVREQNLERMKNYVKTEVTDKEVFEFIFLKIWKSMFYFFWNSDKAKTQKAQAEKIANFFDYIDESEVEKYHVWIKCFLLEFIKKWTKIDFLRLDKYIMLLQTIIRKYFDFNLKKNKYTDAVRIFDYIVLAIKSGFYNFNFVSNVLNNIGYIIDEFFKDESFKNSPDHEFFSLFTDKLISLFLTIRDKREISNFKENLFNRIDLILIKDPFYRDSELKKLYQRKIFEKATSKEEVPEPQRTLLFKVYKKVKYLDENYEEKEKEKLKTYDVDPVNDYILKKSYSNRTRMTKIEKMRLLANKRRFQESNQKQLALMEKEKMAKLTNEINKEFSQKENQKETENKHNLSLNSDANLNEKKKENKNKNKENIKEDKPGVSSNELNNSSKKNDNNISNNQKKKQKLNETADLPNNDTFCSEKEVKNTKNSETKIEEILSENIIKLDSDSDENKKEKKSDKAKAESKKQSTKAAVAALTQNKKKPQKESDSEDMDLEEDLDYEEEESSNQNESAEADENSDLSSGDENAEQSEENAEESEEEPFDYDEELEYYDGEDGEEFEFEEEGLMDNEDEMDFLDDLDEEGELDSQEEAYYESLYGKSLSSIYSKIQNKNGNKEKAKSAEPKTQEEIEMQKSLIIARNNSIKNAMLKTSSNNNFLLGKKRNKGLLNGSDNAADGNKNQNSKAAGNGSENNRNGNNNNNGQKKNNGNAAPKKKVNFTLSKNTFNSYEQLKPITLTSNKRVIPNNGSPAKGALKKKSKLN